jgi:hypothetical protein
LNREKGKVIGCAKGRGKVMLDGFHVSVSKAARERERERERER